MKQLKQSKIISEQVVYKGKWLGVSHISYSIGDCVNKNCEAIFRTTSKNKNMAIDGVDIIPIIKYKDKPSEIVMIMDFRPPIKGFCLEFPTGLAEDTQYEENALRELTEETGYIAEKLVKMPMPVIYCDPWKSKQSSLMFIAIINGDDESSKRHQSLEETQNIKVVKFVIDNNLPKTVSEFIKNNNYHLEGKLWSFCIGFWLKHYIQSETF